MVAMTDPVGAPRRARKATSSRAAVKFASAPNPHAQPTTHAISRSFDFRRIAMLPRRTHWRDFSEALTLAFALPARAPNTCPYNCPCKGTGYMKLRPLQAWALAEIYEQRGGIGLMGAGSGKTLVSALLPQLMGWQRPVLLVPAGLRNKTLKIDFPLLARHWKMPPASGPGSLDVRSYEELSQVSFADYLEFQRVPDGIEADEFHNLKNVRAARSKRFERFFSKISDCEFGGFTGSPAHRSVMDYGHIINTALGDGSPLPHSQVELRSWADHLDASTPEHVRPSAGALFDLCMRGETSRDGYKRRLLETPGIVSSSELSTNIGLRIMEIPHPEIPKVVVEAFHRLRNTGQTPDGEVATTKLDQVRHAEELLLGMYLRWLWPIGPDGRRVPDLEWLKKRRAWRKYVRKMTSHTRTIGGVSGQWLDTEAQVARAVVNGLIVCSEDDINVEGKVIRSNVDVHAEWIEVRDDRKAKWWPGDSKKENPPTEVVWLSECPSRGASDGVCRCAVACDYMIRELERWAKAADAKGEPGVIWIKNIGFMEALRARGNVCYAAGEDEIELESGSRSVFASFAHKTGKNLHMWHRMCFSNPFTAGDAWEQGLAREHRPRQEADEVVADVYLGCRETWWSFERARIDADYLEATLGQAQRLNKATIVSTGEDVVLERCARGDPLWAETGHAKIDGKLGQVDPKTGKRTDTITPILTALRAQAKQEAETDTDEDEDEESSADEDE